MSLSTMRLHRVTLPLLLSKLTTAWSIAFYTGQNCSNDVSFDNIVYLGDGKSSCIVPGDPMNYCVWHTNNGQTQNMCTGPMEPAPGSFRFAQDAKCFVSWSADCAVPNWPGSEDEPEANTCYKTSDLSGGSGSILTFECWTLAE